MRKKDWGTFKNQCKICGLMGHNIRGCPAVLPLAERAERKLEAGDRISWKEIACMREILKRDEMKKRRQSRKGKTKAKRKCGFCGGKDHNRRNCARIEKTRELFKKANQIWREQFVAACDEVGYGVGALLEVESPALLMPGEIRYIAKTALVTSIPWNELGFMSKYTGNWEYQTNITLPIMIVDMRKTANAIGEGDIAKLLKTPKAKGLFGSNNERNFKMAGYTKIKILTKASTAPPEGWLESEDDENIEWLIKKHSYANLKNMGIVQLAKRIIGGKV